MRQETGFRMIIAGTDYNGAGRIGRGQSIVPGANRGNGSARGENGFFAGMLEARREEPERGVGNVSPNEEFAKNQAAGRLISNASQDGKQLSKEEMLKLLAEHREEILKKIKNGDTGVKIPIGSMVLTQEEWEKLLDSFDEAQEKMKEQIREESGETLPEKRPDTTVNGDKVFAAEDTGHDLKPLEELLGETNVKGKNADAPGEQELQTDEEDREQA